MTLVQVHVAVNGVVVYKGEAESVGPLADHRFHWQDGSRARGEVVHDDLGYLSLATAVLQGSIDAQQARAAAILEAHNARVRRPPNPEPPEPRSIDPMYWPKGYIVPDPQVPEGTVLVVNDGEVVAKMTGVGDYPHDLAVAEDSHDHARPVTDELEDDILEDDIRDYFKTTKPTIPPTP